MGCRGGHLTLRIRPTSGLSSSGCCSHAACSTKRLLQQLSLQSATLMRLDTCRHMTGLVAFSINVDFGLHFPELEAQLVATFNTIFQRYGYPTILCSIILLCRLDKVGSRFRPPSNYTRYFFPQTSVQIVVVKVVSIFAEFQFVGCCSRCRVSHDDAMVG